MAKKDSRALAWVIAIALLLGASYAAGWYASKQRYSPRVYYDLTGQADEIRFSPELTARYRADLDRLSETDGGQDGGNPNYWFWVDACPGAAALLNTARVTPFRAYECTVTLTNLTDKGYHHGGFGIVSPDVPVYVNDNFFSDPENHVFAGKSQTGTLQILAPTEGMTDSEIRDLLQSVYLTASFMVDAPNSVCHTAFCLGDAVFNE